jgi:dCTP diphosphatase
MEEDESKMALEEIDVIEQMMDNIHEFALERQWNQFHTPRSLCLALMGEAGELAEIFQWKGDENMKRDEKMLDKVSQEMADVAIYLLRMATVCKIPLADLSLQPVVFAQVQSLSPSSGSL